MVTENELDNQLIKQKDELIRMINRKKYDEAAIILAFIKPMWDVCDYGYKWDEIKERLLRG